MLKAVTVALIVLSLVGCTSLQVMQGTNAQMIQESVKQDDQIVLFTVQGTKYRLKVTDVTNQGITGVERTKTYTFAYSQIRSVEIKNPAPLKTTGLTVLCVAGAAAIVFVAVILISLVRLSNGSK